MLRFLLGTSHPRIIDVEAFPDCKASDRKLRLFACACFASVRHLIAKAPPARHAVEVAELYADGMFTPADLVEVEGKLRERLDHLEGPWRASRDAERTALLPTYAALALAFQVAHSQAPKAAYYAASNASWTAAAAAHPDAVDSDGWSIVCKRAEKRVQAGLLRDILGPLPFRVVAVNDFWRAPAVLAVAGTIYEQRSFDLMPALGAALSDAGCTNAEILGHCGGPSSHVRGCWVVDLVLNRE
jgi:hypothetical protein